MQEFRNQPCQGEEEEDRDIGGGGNRKCYYNRINLQEFTRLKLISP